MQDVFIAARAGAVEQMQLMIQSDPSIVNAKLYCYEGHDVYGTLTKFGSKRCYTFTGSDKDGFTYPMHVAAESGHKEMVLFLQKRGADTDLEDYRHETAEKKANGRAKDAFLELKGLKFGAHERYEGENNKSGQPHGYGTKFMKFEGYQEEETKIYDGSWKNGKFSGQGVLYHRTRDKSGVPIKAYMGAFLDGKKHGRGTEYNEAGFKLYVGTFKLDRRHGHGIKFEVRNDILRGPQEVRTYEGSWREGIEHGYGVAFFPDNHKYEGAFLKGEMHGAGTYYHSNGDRFEGMFVGNKPNGSGSFYKSVLVNAMTRVEELEQEAQRLQEEISKPRSEAPTDIIDDLHDQLESIEDELKESQQQVDELVNSDERIDGKWQQGNRIEMGNRQFIPEPDDMGFGNPDGNSDDEDAEDSKPETHEDAKGVFDGLGAFTRRQKSIAVCEFLQIAADFVDGADQVLGIRISDGPHYAMTMESQRSFNEMKTVVESAITDVIKRHKTLRSAKKRADEAFFEDSSSPSPAQSGIEPDANLTWAHLFQDPSLEFLSQKDAIARIQRAAERDDRTVLDKLHSMLRLPLHVRKGGSDLDFLDGVLNELHTIEDKKISLEDFREKLRHKQKKRAEENQGINDEASVSSATLLSEIPADDCELHEMYSAFEEIVVVRMTRELQELQGKDGNVYASDLLEFLRRQALVHKDDRFLRLHI